MSEAAVAVKERPILFSAESVRGILDGRKTQTRRVVTEAYKSRRKDGCKLVPELLRDIGVGCACPYGKPGDRLWVREATESYHLPNIITGEPTNGLCGRYKCDESPVVNEHGFDLVWWHSKPTCPSIFMPRWASRITLEIVSVRVERVQEISEADAQAEGSERPELSSHVLPGCPPPFNVVHPLTGSLRDGFSLLWDSINAKRGYGWEANPFVWVIEFKKLEAN